MALVTHQFQGSYATFALRPISWRRRVEPKRLLLRSIFVNRKSCLCVGAPLVQESKGKSLRILSFKGKTDESGGRGSGSKSGKNSVEYSYVPQDREETLTESSKVQNGQISSMPEAVERLSGSLVIQNLFKSWLTLLHTPSPDVIVDGTSEKTSSSKETSEMKSVIHNKERGEILKAVWCHFLGMDATIKMALIIFVGAPLVQESKGKSLRILSFKGKTDESGGRGSGSKSGKNSVEYSYVPQDREETLTESSKVQNGQISSMPEAVERLSGSLVIQNLFKSWLTLLHTPSPDVIVDGTSEKPSSSKETSEMKSVIHNKERGEILKAVWCHFLGMDATIKMALIIFFPMYVAVNIKYGAEVSKDMTPFWIGGPLLVALYVKLFKLVCMLYAFTFRQTVKVIKNSPSYCLMTYDFIVSGKLKEIIRVYLWQPLVDISKFDYKDVLKRVEAWREAKKVEWDEKMEDFVESIWPYYCRTLRFLKRANLV